MTALNPRVSGHFLAGKGGPLATVLWRPPHGSTCRFAALYVPPLGDEMNKSRRMVALQARALATIGGNVAAVDLRGTGDSGGAHGDATWEGWREDIMVAWDWLNRLEPVPCVLWGLRLGGLLAADLIASAAIAPAALILWQPVISGRSFFNQLFRLAAAQQLIGRTDATADSVSMRETLATGACVEIAGYDIHPALVADAENVNLEVIVMRGTPTIWRETTVGIPGSVSPASARVAAAWTVKGAAVDIAAVNGPSFWMTQEIAEAPALIAATTPAVETLIAMRDAHSYE